MMECYCHIRVHHEIVPSERNSMVILHDMNRLQSLAVWEDIGATQIEQCRSREMLFRENWSCLFRLIGYVHTTSLFPGAATCICLLSIVDTHHVGSKSFPQR